MKPVPFFDLTRQYRSLRSDVRRVVDEVCVSTAFSGGKFVEEFETAFARYCGSKYTRALNSGTDAVHLALAALGVGPGDEVIVPANTFIASVWGISYLGATPVFVDCLPETWEIDPKAAVRAITSKTKAVVAVHLYGVPCDIDALKKAVGQRKIAIIEDCAQAHGARIGREKVGTIGDIGAFSFYPSKNLGAFGEGGAITTGDLRYADRVALLRSHGETAKYHHDIIGHNMRMDGIQAAILKVKLRHLNTWNMRRNAIVAEYRKKIGNRSVTLQTIPRGVIPAFHLFVVTVEDRARFQQHLRRHGIMNAMHYPIPCHLQKAYKHLGYRRGDFPNAEYLAEHCVSLPLFPEMRAHEVKRVIAAVNSYQV